MSAAAAAERSPTGSKLSARRSHGFAPVRCQTIPSGGSRHACECRGGAQSRAVRPCLFTTNTLGIFQWAQPLLIVGPELRMLSYPGCAVPSISCSPDRARAGSCTLSHRRVRAPLHRSSVGAAYPDKQMTGAMVLFLIAAILAFFAMCTCLDEYLLICPCLKLPEWTPGPSPFDKQPLSSESTPLKRDAKVEPPRADQPTVVVDGRQDYVRHVT